MRTALASLALLRPNSVAEALRMMTNEGPLTPLAGCTDVYVNLQFGTARDKRFVDLWPLDEMRGIAEVKQSKGQSVLRIGALTTYTEIIASPSIRKRAPMLVAAAGEIGGRQIQNRGTLGGNIANASPAGDSLPVLAALDATVVLRDIEGERRVPLTSFYTGYRASVRREDELIVAIEIPRVAGKQWWRKVGTRRAQAISKVMLAGVRSRADVRLSIGSVGPTVLRLHRTEEALASGASIDKAMRVLAEEIAPIDDIRSTADYRRKVSQNLLQRFWSDTA
jgi:CO/xanthine dehydrogenase FAD-binding subunit